MYDTPWIGWITTALAGALLVSCGGDEGPGEGRLDRELTAVLEEHGYSGTVEASLESRLGRAVNADLARAGRLLFFDPVMSLAEDGKNTCAGCHAPNASFGGTQSIAIGVDSNARVGPARTGPRNRRRSPTVVNTAFYPRQMLNGRFEALAGTPFDNAGGFLFPDPEGRSLSHLPHLLAAQAFVPVVDRAEMAGEFGGDREEMRAEIARRVDGIATYRELLGSVFPEVAAGAAITFEHVARAIAEFQIDLVFADAPFDRFARGEHDALTTEQKRGALLFFGEAGCVACHAVDVPFGSGEEMFTDFEHHVLGVPQLVPADTNVTFDGPDERQDFGRERVTGNAADRYAFRTSPLRNVGLQPTFMHNGAFTTLEEAIRHHLDATASARGYVPDALDEDLRDLGPIEPVLQRLDPLISDPPVLDEEQLDELIAFVGEALTDPRAEPDRLRHLVPASVPSGEPVHDFAFE